MIDYKIKTLKPLNNDLVTTAKFYEDDEKTESGLIKKTRVGTLMEFQTVISIGAMVREINPGDTVIVNPKRFARYNNKYKGTTSDEDGRKVEQYGKDEIVGYDFPIREVGDELVLHLNTHDIECVVEVEEVDVEAMNYETTPTLIDPIEVGDNGLTKAGLYVPDKETKKSKLITL